MFVKRIKVNKYKKDCTDNSLYSLEILRSTLYRAQRYTADDVLGQEEVNNNYREDRNCNRHVLSAEVSDLIVVENGSNHHRHCPLFQLVGNEDHRRCIVVVPV